MSTRRISANHRTPSASWAGKASSLRREQVRAVAARPAATACPAATFTATAGELWDSLVEVLDGIDGPSSAVLCTVDGEPVAGYGLSKLELRVASTQIGRMFAGRAGAAGHRDAVETVEINREETHTVIAAVAAPMGTHLLSVTAEKVSMPVLKAWTCHAATELRAAIAAAVA